MKNTFYILYILVLCSCKSKDKAKVNDTISNTSITTSDPLKNESPKVAIKPYKINEDYTVVDTGGYSTGPMGGTYEVIKRNGTIADTIDRGFGIKTISKDFYLYNVLDRTKGMGSGSEQVLSIDSNQYFLISNNSKVLLKKLTEKFDNYFSSPEVINNKIYYWQITQLDNQGKVSISAAEYDPAAKTTKSHFIMNNILETDDSGYFPLPYTKSDTICFFAGKDKIIKFSKDFKAYN